MDLRKEIASRSELFQLKKQSDAAEVLNFVLGQIHKTMVDAGTEDSDYLSCHERCPAHSCFNLQCFEEITCNCTHETKIKTWNYCSFSFPIYIEETLEKAVQLNGENIKNYVGNLRNCYVKRGKIETCTKEPPGCSEAIREYKLLTAPEVLLLNIIGKWDIPTNHDTKVLKIIALFSSEITLSTLFQEENLERYRIKGWISFGFRHYVAYVQDRKSKNWFKFNDMTISQPGDGSYFAAVTEMINSEHHPVLYCFEQVNPNATEDENRPLCNEKEWEALIERAKRGSPAWESVSKSVEIPKASSERKFNGPGSWICFKSACVQLNDASAAICKKCNARKEESDMPQRMTQSFTAPSSFSFPESPNIPKRLDYCMKCHRAYLGCSSCVCSRFLLPYKNSHFFVCPTCKLLIEREASTCDNCGAELRTLKFKDGCVVCGGGIPPRGYCLKCKIDTEASPCVFCGFSDVSCTSCKYRTAEK